VLRSAAMPSALPAQLKPYSLPFSLCISSLMCCRRQNCAACDRKQQYYRRMLRQSRVTGSNKNLTKDNHQPRWKDVPQQKDVQANTPPVKCGQSWSNKSNSRRLPCCYSNMPA
jgi:hypothetical protein